MSVFQFVNGSPFKLDLGSGLATEQANKLSGDCVCKPTVFTGQTDMIGRHNWVGRLMHGHRRRTATGVLLSASLHTADWRRHQLDLPVVINQRVLPANGDKREGKRRPFFFLKHSHLPTCTK